MGDLKPRGVTVTLEGAGERHLLFDFNVIEALQDKYEKSLWEIMNDIVNNSQKKGTWENIPMFRFVLATLLNAECERARLLHGEEIPAVEERDVGCMVGIDNYGEVLKAILKAYGISMPEPEQPEDPNAKSGQQNQ
ncbi:MAG: hypothetical protein LUI07_08400 [Lachnospiraceae bacterium]|nr:hypothetical protein [Lachnospiraceae bacterium]